jgi:hypothetical protein
VKNEKNGLDNENKLDGDFRRSLLQGQSVERRHCEGTKKRKITDTLEQLGLFPILESILELST